MNLASICWRTWTPTDHVSIVCLRCNQSVLLMHKLRGFGASKIVLPGGHKQKGETMRDCAIREFREEVGLIPQNPHHLGSLRYQFLQGFKLQIEVFYAQNYHGDLCTSDEAEPFWQQINAIPFDQMWSDTQHWMPLALEQKTFQGSFVFDQELMVEMDLVSNFKN